MTGELFWCQEQRKVVVRLKSAGMGAPEILFNLAAQRGNGTSTEKCWRWNARYPGAKKGATGWTRTAVPESVSQKTSDWENLWRTHKSDLGEKELAFHIGHFVSGCCPSRDLSSPSHLSSIPQLGEMEVGLKQQFVSEGGWEWER